VGRFNHPGRSSDARQARTPGRGRDFGVEHDGLVGGAGRRQGADLHLYRDGVIELEDALGVASNPHDLQVALRNQGLVAEAEV
jgi:hypothetical protein